MENNEEFWRDLMNSYRGWPAAWRVKSEISENRNSMHLGYYLNFTEKSKGIRPTANVNSTEKKINTLWSNYRRKLKKNFTEHRVRVLVLWAYLYVPSVWYLTDLEFSRDREIQIAGTPTMDEDNEEIIFNQK